MMMSFSLMALLLPVLGYAGFAGSAPEGTITKQPFGKTADGHNVELYTLKNGTMTVKVTTYGAIITSIEVPDKAGKIGEVTLGFDTLEGYIKGHPYFGATVGRVGNRIANGKFKLNGKEYTLATNNGPNALHGGLKGFDKVIWKAEDVSGPEGPAVRMTYVSKDGEEGYPGTLTSKVTFRVAAHNELQIDYEATTDADTPINLTNHTYFNLSGPNSGTILHHELMLAADQYTPTDATLIPTGEIAKVEGTPLDFRKAKTIGADIQKIKADPPGYDHNFVLNAQAERKPIMAQVYDPQSGRELIMRTTEPGVQFYTGNFLDGSVVGKGGAYKQYGAFCLEAQHFPDSINKPNFPSAVLKPGQVYKQWTSYQFGTR